MSEHRTNTALMNQIPEQCPQRIESRRTGSGIPDIWCGDCAIESKCLKKYPKKPNTSVCLDHKLSLVQYRWLNNRWRHGFKAFVVLQANRLEWYLFAAPDSWCLLDKHEKPINVLRLNALWYSKAGVDYAEGADQLTINKWLSMPLKNIQDCRLSLGFADREVII